jgi:S1-C subfamily serine protease
MRDHLRRGSVRPACRRLALVVVLSLLGAGILQSPLVGVIQPAAAQQLDPALIGKLKDAVVLIEVTLNLREGQAGGSGSGFVISERGHVVTNAHVVAVTTQDETGRTLVADDRQVQVVFHPGTAQEQGFPAQVLRENHDLDLALLKIERDTPVYVELGDSDAAGETSRIYVCGHPLGLREISIRTGTVTAHRTWDNHRYIEHDASAEEGNSGGPVVDSQARVLGVHTMTLASKGMLTKFAIPSNVVRAWLATDASEDPPPPIPGKVVRDMLDGAGLIYEEADTGLFSLPYDNDVTVYVHDYDQFLRVFVPLGELPGGTKLLQGYCALEALRFNYADPVGRLSLLEEEGIHKLFWECQAPLGAATDQYLKTVADVGANQVVRWRQTLNGEEPADPEHLYPGGDEAALLARLEELIKAAQLKYEAKDEYYLIPYDNDVNVAGAIWRGMGYVHAYTGGMPGESLAQQALIAIELLRRNWDDPFGRLSLDDDNDLVWESQVPSDFLTPDYLAILSSTCANQVAAFWDVYGHVDLNG